MRRRNLLAGLSGGLAALAGCNSPSGTDGDGSPPKGETVRWPNITGETASVWTQVDTRKQTYEASRWGINVTGYERTKILENVALRRQVREKTLGQFDQTLAVFFASRIDLRGYATIAVTSDVIAEQVLPTFTDMMEQQGVVEVTETTPASPAPSRGTETTTHEYEGTFETPQITRTVQIPDVGERTLKIERDTLPIRGFVSIWKPDNPTAFVAGGAYPADDFEKRGTVSVTGDGKADGIDVTVSVDLNVQPRALRRSLVELVESVG